MEMNRTSKDGVHLEAAEALEAHEAAALGRERLPGLDLIILLICIIE